MGTVILMILAGVAIASILAMTGTKKKAHGHNVKFERGFPGNLHQTKNDWRSK